MPVTIAELKECLLRLLAGEFIVPETRVFLLSRDGEQLRGISELRYLRGKNQVVIEREFESDDTITVAGLLLYCAGPNPQAAVRLVADGFSSTGEPLEAVRLAAEIKELNRVDFSETDVVLCT